MGVGGVSAAYAEDVGNAAQTVVRATDAGISRWSRWGAKSLPSYGNEASRALITCRRSHARLRLLPDSTGPLQCSSRQKTISATTPVPGPGVHGSSGADAGADAAQAAEEAEIQNQLTVNGKAAVAVAPRESVTVTVT